MFVSAKGSKLLRGISNSSVCERASKHRQAGKQFLVYVMLVLVTSIVYFKIAYSRIIFPGFSRFHPVVGTCSLYMSMAQTFIHNAV